MGILETLGLRETKAKREARHKAEDDAYAQQLAPVKQQLATLKKHGQAQRVKTAIDTATSLLAQAEGFGSTRDYKRAGPKLVAAAAACTAGTAVADGWARYSPKRAAAALLLHQMKGQYADPAFHAGQEAVLVTADAAATASPPNFDLACTRADSISTTLFGSLQKWYVTDAAPKIQALKDHAAAGFLTAQIQQIETLHAEVKAHIAARLPAKALLTGRQVSSLISVATRIADRRAPFDTQRKLTKKALDDLAAKPALAGERAALNQRLLAADDQASLATMQIEAGTQALKDIATHAAALPAVEAAAQGYRTARLKADTELAALAKIAATAKIEKDVAAITTLLGRATTITGAIDVSNAAADLGADAGQRDWKAALAIVVQAQADLTALQAAANGAKEVAAAQALIIEAGGKVPKLNLAIAALRKQVKAAQDGFEPAYIKKEIDAVVKAIGEAEAQIADGLADGVGVPLQAAAGQLATARAAQLAHAHFAPLAATVEQRRAALPATLPPKVKALHDTAAATLLKAQNFDKAKASADALATVRQAAVEIGTAEDANTRWADFELARKALDARAQLLPGGSGSSKPGVVNQLGVALGQANDLKFDLAKASLDKAECLMEAHNVKKVAEATPLDAAKLLEGATQMMKTGGAKDLDELISGLSSKKVPFEVVAGLAKARFGIDLTVDDGPDAREKIKSGKGLCKMLAVVPGDVANNPSLKKVERRRVVKDGQDQSGGFYQSSEDLIVMNGRPNITQQGFGPDIASQLPDNVDPACQPKDNTPLDYFDFATLHEVGHAVDDARHFMDSRGAGAAYGGWKSYGGNVEPIAAAVATWAGYDETAEQKQYVLDLILDNLPVPPVPAPEKKAAWDAGLQKVTDWHGRATSKNMDGIWWHQSDCDKITIGGVVYQEAYPKTWVSYLAAARQKGITGYQFRAPGEWFAELYASFHSGKLKKGHPSESWLKSLTKP